MSLTRDRKLDVLGAVLAVVLLASVGLAVFGAIEAGSDGTTTPEASFEVERINDTHVSLVHAGGEALRGDELIATINGRERVVGFPERVTEGTAVTVQVRSGQTIRIYWTGDRATRERLDAVRT